MKKNIVFPAFTFISINMKHLFTALCIWHTICTLHAQPGDLDIQFDNDGILVSQGTPGQDVAYSVAAHPDGDIVAVGSFLYGYEYFGVVKYSAVGEERWRKTYGLGPQSRCLADQVLIDGKILVAAGTYMSNSSEFTLLRYISGPTSSTHDTEKPFGNIHVNPNPAVSYVELHYNLPSADKTTIQLYDALGNRIKTIVGHEDRLSGPQVEQIRLHDGLSPGTYSITIETAKGLRQSTQLVVMH